MTRTLVSHSFNWLFSANATGQSHETGRRKNRLGADSMFARLSVEWSFSTNDDGF